MHSRTFHLGVNLLIGLFGVASTYIVYLWGQSDMVETTEELRKAEAQRDVLQQSLDRSEIEAVKFRERAEHRHDTLLATIDRYEKTLALEVRGFSSELRSLADDMKEYANLVSRLELTKADDPTVPGPPADASAGRLDEADRLAGRLEAAIGRLEEIRDLAPREPLPSSGFAMGGDTGIGWGGEGGGPAGSGERSEPRGWRSDPGQGPGGGDAGGGPGGGDDGSGPGGGDPGWLLRGDAGGPGGGDAGGPGGDSGPMSAFDRGGDGNDGGADRMEGADDMPPGISNGNGNGNGY